jgi:hypothetical protein
MGLDRSTFRSARVGAPIDSGPAIYLCFHFGSQLSERRGCVLLEPILTLEAVQRLFVIAQQMIDRVGFPVILGHICPPARASTAKPAPIL